MKSVSEKARIGQQVEIGEFSIVHDDVEIGDHSRIGSHCVIGEPSAAAQGAPLVIGAGSTIRSHSVFYAGSTLGPGLSTGHSVLVREGTRAGRDLQIGTQSDIEGHCEIGDWVKVHSEVHIAQGSRIGDFVYLHPKVLLANDPFPPSPIITGVAIGELSVVCTGSLVLPGVEIGAGVLVGAGSIVRNALADVHCYRGDPATAFCRLDQFFNPEYGMYHPWIRRFREKYPADCSEAIDAGIARIDALIERAKSETA